MAGAKEGVQAPELWVFPQWVSHGLWPPHMTGWSHRTMEWAQLPPGLTLYSAEVEENRIINTDAGGYLASLACFLGMDLLFLAVLQLSWGPLQIIPPGSLLVPWTFSTAPEFN